MSNDHTGRELVSTGQRTHSWTAARNERCQYTLSTTFFVATGTAGSRSDSCFLCRLLNVATANDDTHLFLHAQKGPPHQKQQARNIRRFLRSSSHKKAFAFGVLRGDSIHGLSKLPLVSATSRDKRSTSHRHASPVPQGRLGAPQHRRSYLNMFVILAASKTYFPTLFFNIYGALCISRHLFPPIGLGNPLFAAPVQSIFSLPSRGSPFFLNSARSLFTFGIEDLYE
jgi:hypothetical protein